MKISELVEDSRAEAAYILRHWKSLPSGCITGELEVEGRKVNNFTTRPIVQARRMGPHRERIVAFTEGGKAYTLEDPQNLDKAEDFIFKLSRNVDSEKRHTGDQGSTTNLSIR